jgi:hypothetical protein
MAGRFAGPVVVGERDGKAEPAPDVGFAAWLAPGGLDADILEALLGDRAIQFEPAGRLLGKNFRLERIAEVEIRLHLTHDQRGAAIRVDIVADRIAVGAAGHRADRARTQTLLEGDCASLRQRRARRHRGRGTLR